MTTQRIVKLAVGAILTLSVILLAAVSRVSPRVRAQEFRDDDEESLVRRGFDIAPVNLDLNGKNVHLVGLGSYLVNAVGDCNGCHTAGAPPNFNYANGNNPYFGQHTKVDPTTYLAGGTDFGPALPPSAAIGGYPPGSNPASYPPAPFDPFYVGPDIITRNLTPDKTGRPEGGHTLAEFKEILKTGKDFDHIHPTCTSALPTPTPANCIPPPFPGSNIGEILQIMPWPVFHNLTDHQMDAVYEYLRSIPCIDNNFSTPPAGAPNELRNDCGTPHAANQSPTWAPRGRRHHTGQGD
jgi:hypothetical protein